MLLAVRRVMSSGGSIVSHLPASCPFLGVTHKACVGFSMMQRTQDGANVERRTPSSESQTMPVDMSSLSSRRRVVAPRERACHRR
jgi:hypothetical protein